MYRCGLDKVNLSIEATPGKCGFRILLSPDVLCYAEKALLADEGRIIFSFHSKKGSFLGPSIGVNLIWQKQLFFPSREAKATMRGLQTIFEVEGLEFASLAILKDQAKNLLFPFRKIFEARSFKRSPHAFLIQRHRSSFEIFSSKEGKNHFTEEVPPLRDMRIWFETRGYTLKTCE